MFRQDQSYRKGKSAEHDLADTVGDELERQGGQDHAEQAAQNVVPGPSDQILDAISGRKRQMSEAVNRQNREHQ